MTPPLTQVRFNSPHGLPITPARKGRKGGGKGGGGEDDDDGGGDGGSSGKIVLAFKKYMFDGGAGRGRRIQQ